MRQGLKITRRKARRQRRRGAAMLVLILLLLVIFMSLAVMSVDVAFMQLVRTELRAATDASARAGSEALSRLQDENSAVQAAIDAAARNNVANRQLTLTANEIGLGRSDPSASGRFIFQAGGDPPNSVQVIAEMSDDKAAGSVPLLMGRLLGVDRFQPVQDATATHVDREICLVMDRSGSMMRGLGPNLPPGQTNCDPPHPTLSRWSMTVGAVSVFLAEMDLTDVEERVAMVSYGSNLNACGITYRISQKDEDLTTNYPRITNALVSLAQNPIRGRTSISAGIDEGIQVLIAANVRPLADKTMIVLTDGRHNLGIEPIIPARAAADENIVIHTVTFSDEAEQGRMQQVADATGGRHFHAPDAEALREAFRQIARTLAVVLTD